MYYLQKTITINASNYLDLNYESKDSKYKEYFYRITVKCKSDDVNQNGMIVDSETISKIIEKLSNQNLNELIPFNPTAENLAKYICHLVPCCYRVDVGMSDGTTISYTKSKK